MQNLFLITSSIIPKFNQHLIPAELRYEQTIKGIESIRKKDLDSFIILSENSNINMNYKNELKNLVDQLIILPEIDFKIGSDMIKSLGEMYIIQKTLEIIEQKIDLKNFKRFFKISGRYELSDDFDIKFYNLLETKNKYCFKAWDERFAYDTILWSMDINLFKEYKNLVPLLFQELLNFKYPNIEIAKYFLIDEKKVFKLAKACVQGFSNTEDGYNKIKYY